MPDLSGVDHVPGRPQRWPSVDADINTWVETTLGDVTTALGDGLVGVYLHGSLAMGCYYRPKSDLDLLVVCTDSLPPGERRTVARALLDASNRRPTVGDLEASVMRVTDTRDFVHPAPYEVHFGVDWTDAIRDDKVDYGADNTDPDLAAHCTMIRSRGITLQGAQIEEVFAPVPPETYVSSIREDLDWILRGDNILTSPFYGVLNACRVLMVLAHGPNVVASKEEAGNWAVTWAPTEHRGLITQCLTCYRSTASISEQERRTHGHSWKPRQLLAFRDWVRSLL